MAAIAARSWIAGLALVGALVASEMLKPDAAVARSAMISLEQVVPQHLGGWRLEAAPAPVQPKGDSRRERPLSDQQILARTYVDDIGRRVMLVISYGTDPSTEGLQGHRPEYCYQAQGFSVQLLSDEWLALGADRKLPVRRLMAERGSRREPITYWMLIGQRAVRPGWERKLEQLRAGLGGRVPEGMLVRVSSLGHEARAGHALQAQFIEALLASIDASTRDRIAGVAI